MALLVLTLSLTPCAESANSMGEGKELSESTTTGHHDDEQQQHDCSPFCSCSCCAGFSLNLYSGFINILSLYKSNAIGSYLPSDIIDVAIPIWQPPQLV